MSIYYIRAGKRQGKPNLLKSSIIINETYLVTVPPNNDEVALAWVTGEVGEGRELQFDSASHFGVFHPISRVIDAQL